MSWFNWANNGGEPEEAEMPSAVEALEPAAQYAHEWVMEVAQKVGEGGGWNNATRLEYLISEGAYRNMRDEQMRLLGD
jgi:hypothetical protein